jgi:hypothetical protein
VAWRGLLTVAGLLAGLLVATSAGYGYHRGELYFVMMGGHPSWDTSTSRRSCRCWPTWPTYSPAAL